MAGTPRRRKRSRALGDEILPMQTQEEWIARQLLTAPPVDDAELRGLETILNA